MIGSAHHKNPLEMAGRKWKNVWLVPRANRAHMTHFPMIFCARTWEWPLTRFIGKTCEIVKTCAAFHTAHICHGGFVLKTDAIDAIPARRSSAFAARYFYWFVRWNLSHYLFDTTSLDRCLRHLSSWPSNWFIFNRIAFSARLKWWDDAIVYSMALANEINCAEGFVRRNVIDWLSNKGMTSMPPAFQCKSRGNKWNEKHWY